jgi:hypothetical protein
MTPVGFGLGAGRGGNFPGEVSPAHMRSSFSASQSGRTEGAFSCEVGGLREQNWANKHLQLG